VTSSGARATVACRVVVRGFVQGVFFRDTARREARRHGVSGWVRNCPDGTVEAWFEGPPDAVAALVRWSGEGPRGAEVTSVDVADVAPSGLSGFTVR
jgi:acylphosphatase